MKKEICYHCGQEIDKKIFIKHAVKMAKKAGMPSFAKLLEMTNYK